MDYTRIISTFSNKNNINLMEQLLGAIEFSTKIEDDHGTHY
jgi:hypothetical protein